MKLRYKQLTDYLLSKLPERYRPRFYAWMENGRLLNQGRTVTDNGVEIARIQYEAVFFFDELPFKEINALELMAHIQLWLNENDPDREILDYYETPFDLDIINDDVADLSFTITFNEPITAVKDEKGQSASTVTPTA